MKEGYVIFSLGDNQQLANAISNKFEIEIGAVEIRNFPDEEYYIRIDTDVKDKIVLLVCRLDHPNAKILPLIFMTQTIKELGANKICLISPYLPYMRQDKRFKSGEAITSLLFAKYLSGCIDDLITIDPHLHRIPHLEEIYSIDSIAVLHSSRKIAEWIHNNVDSPFIIGPDEESQQWVAEVAMVAKAPYAIIKKERYGDRKVKMTVPTINGINRTIVLVDDIISTGSSMLAAIKEFISRGYKKPVCIGIHALFDNTTYDNLLLAGAKEVVSCNTILHPSNKIDITDIIVEDLSNRNFRISY